MQGTQASWTPYWSLRRRPWTLDLKVVSVDSRPADDREPNVKKGGTALGVVALPTFVVVSSMTPSGAVDCVVPAADEPLVKAFFIDRIDSK